jgi:hypothetical protein
VSHRNAPLSETGRLRLARCVVEDGWPLRRAAERFQVSATTAARGAGRYRLADGAGMVDRSSRPHRSPRRTPTRTERRIIKVRVLRRWGPARIGYLLGLHPPTVHRVRMDWSTRSTSKSIRSSSGQVSGYSTASRGQSPTSSRFGYSRPRAWRTCAIASSASSRSSGGRCPILVSSQDHRINSKTVEETCDTGCKGILDTDVQNRDMMGHSVITDILHSTGNLPYSISPYSSVRAFTYTSISWPASGAHNATPSVFHQRHIGRVLRSSCNVPGRRLASPRD